MSTDRQPCDICMRMAINDGTRWLKENRAIATGKSFEDVEKIYRAKYPNYTASFKIAWVNMFGEDQC